MDSSSRGNHLCIDHLEQLFAPSVHLVLAPPPEPSEPAPAPSAEGPAKLTPRRRRQAERYHYLVADVVAHLARRYPARLHDEIEALAAEGLVLAASADDLDIPTPFARFAWKRMANHVRIQLRKLALFGDDVVRGEPELDVPAATGSSGDAAYLEHMHAAFSGEGSRRAARDAAVEDACERRHTLLALAGALAELDSSSADVVRLKTTGASWPVVATTLGISVSTARRVHAEVMEQMRRSLTAAGVSTGCEVGDGGLFASNPAAEAEQAA